MSRIFRYEVPVDDQWHEFPELNGDVIHVASRIVDVVEFWAVHYEEGDPALLGLTRDAPRRFRVFGTGHPLPGTPYLVHGSALIGPLVWHLVEDEPWLLTEPDQ